MPSIGIEHPGDRAGHGVCRIGRSAALLAEDRVTRPQFSQPIAQQPLGFGVDDVTGSVGVLFDLHRVIAVGAGVGAENLGTSAPHERGGLVGQPLGDRPQLRRFVVRCASPVHRITGTDRLAQHRGNEPANRRGTH